MTGHTRRNFLKVSGALLGGIAAGSTVVTAAESRNRFIVEADGNTKRAAERSDLNIVHDLDQIDVAVVEGAESDVKDLKAKYAPDLIFSLDLPVEDAPVRVEETEQSATDEPLYPLQWDKQAQNIPEAQEVTRGEGTRVAIIDTGVGAGHPDLQHAVNEELSRNFTDDDFGAPGPYGGYHGTHVAGITAANDQNEAGVVGTAPGTEIVDCRVFSPGSLASFTDILAAMMYAAEIDCDAANLSLGAYPVSRKANGKFYGKVLNSTTSYVRRQGTLLVVSAGNDAVDLQHDNGEVIYRDTDDDGELERIVIEGGHWISLPNEAANVMSISANGPVGFLWDATSVGDEEEPTYAPARYTNYGTNAINVAAPGGNFSPAGSAEEEDGDDFAPPWYLDFVLNCIAEFPPKNPEAPPEEQEPDFSKEPEYGYGWVAGTSMSAPQVTGTAALIRSVNPDLNANRVLRTLEGTATIPDEYDKTYYGAGVINPADAVRAASGNGRGRGRGRGRGKARGRGR